jgi:hypothetical protein
MAKPISGIHHVTAIASNPQRNLARGLYDKILELYPGSGQFGWSALAFRARRQTVI